MREPVCIFDAPTDERLSHDADIVWRFLACEMMECDFKVEHEYKVLTTITEPPLSIEEGKECLREIKEVLSDECFVVFGEKSFYISYKIDPLPTNEKDEGYVYILKWDNENDDIYKIGYTKNLSKRKNTFDIKLPYATRYVYSIRTDKYKTLEKTLHDIFCHQRLNGEWFRLSKSDLDLIETIKKEEENTYWED